MPRFDPRIIQQHAQDLYDRADDLVWKAAASGALMGGMIGWALSFVIRYVGFHIPPLVVIIAAAAAMALSAAASAERDVFTLRLEAQQALCQLMIEQHTGLAVKHLQEINLRGSRAWAASQESQQSQARP